MCFRCLQLYLYVKVTKDIFFRNISPPPSRSVECSVDPADSFLSHEPYLASLKQGRDITSTTQILVPCSQKMERIYSVGLHRLLALSLVLTGRLILLFAADKLFHFVT